MLHFFNDILKVTNVTTLCTAIVLLTLFMWQFRLRTNRFRQASLAPIFHETKRRETIGIILTNLGSPSEPNYSSLFTYLREFLSDKRVIELTNYVWLPILYGFILPFRSSASAAKYARIWTRNGSPLVDITRRQSEALQKRLDALFSESGKQVIVTYGMSYNKPAIRERMRFLRAEGVKKILIVPLYPQPAASTVGSTYDAIFKELMQWRCMPDIRIVSGFCDHPLFIDGICEKIKTYWEQNGKGQKMILSYHGIPQNMWEQGDPYPCYCQMTTRLIKERLNVEDDFIEMAYQSRFGPTEWIKPYFSDRLKSLAEQGYTKIDVVAPSFFTDCLETLDEINFELQNEFQQSSKGGKLRYISCLNDDEEGLKFLTNFVTVNLLQWTPRLLKDSSLRTQLLEGFSLKTNN